MNIYFAWSIMWDQNWSEFYTDIVEFLKTRWRVLSEHVTHTYKNAHVYNIASTPETVFAAYREYLDRADILIAEVSWRSHWTWWELCYAEHVRKIPILAIYKEWTSISAFVEGNEYITTVSYTDMNSCKKCIQSFFDTYPKKPT